MDIVTHGMMGVAIAGPFLGSHTGLATGFVLGSVAPDLDAFSRCFGKQVFLKWHQGWTHSLPLQALGGFIGWLLLRRLSPEFADVPIGLALGAMLHTLLDLTNTYGVRALTPFSKNRFCLEWIFFIDGIVIVLTMAAFIPAFLFLAMRHEPAPVYVVIYLAILLPYFALRGILRHYAKLTHGRDALAIIPSAIFPWEFFVCRREGELVSSWKVNLITRHETKVAEFDIFDREYQQYLTHLPEYVAMKALSPAYHVISCIRDDSLTRIRCRDLRIINFGTMFGALDVTFGPQFEIRSLDFHV